MESTNVEHCQSKSPRSLVKLYGIAELEKRILVVFFILLNLLG